MELPLGRLFVLALTVTAVSAVSAIRRRDGRPGAPLNATEAIEKLQEFGCLPDDFSPPDISNCEDQQETGDKTARLQCVASSLDIAGDSGYDQTAGEAFIDSLSSDEQWTTQQKDTLDTCSKGMDPGLAADEQGVFMLVCWLKTLTFECGRDRLADAAHAVSPENGRAVAMAIAHLTGGRCISRGLKSKAGRVAFRNCTAETGLNLTVLGAARSYFQMYDLSSDMPALSAANVSAVAAQLDRINQTIHCTMQEIGELSEDGTIDYAQISANIDSARGRQWIKTAAKEVVDLCQSQNPQTSDNFIGCVLVARPYACISVKAHMVTLGAGSRGRGGACGRGGRRGARGPAGGRRGRNGRRG